MKLFRIIPVLVFLLYSACDQPSFDHIDLSGTWNFRIDSLDEGMDNQWFNETFPETVTLPGSMAENGKGNDVSVNSKWTGSIIDRSWFTEDKYAMYREEGNVKIPFWLQPVKHYIGAAWYQKTVDIPADWLEKYVEMVLERPHWETQLWINGEKVGMKNTLGTAHVYDLTKFLKKGSNRLSIRVDNSIKDINPGVNSHSISEHTQSNWNGIAGDIALISRPPVYMQNLTLFPDTKNKEVIVKARMGNITGIPQNGILEVRAQLKGGSMDDDIPALKKEIEITEKEEIEIRYSLGDAPMLWDEFNPNLYRLEVVLETSLGSDRKLVNFGMREFKSEDRQFTVNGRPVFLRGTLECAIFPKTGYPSTDVKEWERILRACKDHGLNHMRFHSWCPPEAAFIAADQLGVYLQVECSSWANQGSAIGDGKPIDQWLYKEAEHILEAYGNHPSFCMMAYGNEPAGENQVEFLAEFIDHFKKKDPRRVYTGAAGWPFIKSVDYFNAPEARIQGWGQELNSIINKEAPRTDFDFENIIQKVSMPYVSHEIGQWCVYPNFSEIEKYDGVLKARNFEIFKEGLEENHLGHLADSFLLASGKLQALCYKADIEAALRTKDMAGFQLLDLHDFPGQGTALVGVLDPFWEEKGYITPEEYSRFCNQTVPLARFKKRIFKEGESIEADIEAAHFGPEQLNGVRPTWILKTVDDQILEEGTFPEMDIPIGNGIRIGNIAVSTKTIKEPIKLILEVRVSEFINSWDLWVYPVVEKVIPNKDDIRLVRDFNKKTVKFLEEGGKVLFVPVKGRITEEYGRNVGIGFSSIFWNTAWTRKQKPHTLGILCDPDHPAFEYFPTEYHSNWQWWDAMSHSNAIILDQFSPELKPIVRVIDDWVTNRSLGLIFEVKVGKGKLIVSGIDLMKDNRNRLEARQMLYSLNKYMESETFDPEYEMDFSVIREMYDLNDI
jgi:hypothetical protein